MNSPQKLSDGSKPDQAIRPCGDEGDQTGVAPDDKAIRQELEDYMEQLAATDPANVTGI